MGRYFVFVGLLFSATFFATSNCSAVLPDAPHDLVQNITCADCHANTLPGTGRSAICSTVTCHGAGSSLPHLDHSNDVIHEGQTGPYGNWSTECLDCHNPHFHEQQGRVSTNFNQLYLFDGKIDTITPQTTTTLITFTDLTVHDQTWIDPKTWGAKTGAGRGLIFVANANNPQETFEITSATANSLTVNGVMSAEFIAAITHYAVHPMQFGVIYGQFIHTEVNAKDVVFLGRASFGDNDLLGDGAGDPDIDDDGQNDDSTPDGICQACHVSTLYWRADGTLSAQHYNGEYCSQCHEPEEGFKPGCNACHGGSNNVPPGLALENFNDGGSHERHSSNAEDWSYLTWPRELPCTLCHNNTIGGSGPASYIISNPANHKSSFVDWEFDTSDPRLDAAENPSYNIVTGTLPPSDGTRAFGLCTNIYCHSTVQPDGGVGPPDGYDSMQWGEAATECLGCHNQSGSYHGDGIITGSHEKHVRYYYFGLPLTGPWSVKKCTICHKWSPTASRTSCAWNCHDGQEKQYHVNGSVDVLFDSFAPETAVYTGTPSPGDGYGACQNLYCHSDGTSVATGMIPANITAPWGSPALACTGCHANPPAYISGSPKTNSHQAHSYLSCDACHYGVTTTGDSITDTKLHVNNVYDLQGGVATFDYTYSPTGGTCSNLSCHAYGSATWGDTNSLTCMECHLGAGDVDDFDFANGIPAQIDMSEWNSSGHGKSGILDGMGNDACSYCHLAMVDHHTTAVSNPFKLANASGVNISDNCLICHGTGSSGYDPDGAGGPMPPKNSTVKVDSYHLGPKHSVLANGGKFCWDCHDPHGDANNTRMIQDEVTKESDGFYGIPTPTGRVSATFHYADPLNPAGTDYASFQAPFNRICNVCHATTDHFTSSSGAGASHSAPSYQVDACVDCHPHNGASETEGFQ